MCVQREREKKRKRERERERERETKTETETETERETERERREHMVHTKRQSKTVQVKKPEYIYSSYRFRSHLVTYIHAKLHPCGTSHTHIHTYTSSLYIYSCTMHSQVALKPAFSW